MNKNGKAYEPPNMKIYQFDDDDQILTDSSQVNDPINPTADYAANALNNLFDGTTTTIEK